MKSRGSESSRSRRPFRRSRWRRRSRLRESVDAWNRGHGRDVGRNVVGRRGGRRLARSAGAGNGRVVGSPFWFGWGCGIR